MPLILKNKTNRIAVQFGARPALRSTSELVDQLKAKCLQAAARLAEKQRELAIAPEELADVRYELARRDTAEAFAKAPSPSTMMHQPLVMSADQLLKACGCV